MYIMLNNIHKTVILLFCLALLAGCAVTPYSYEPGIQETVEARAEAQEKGAFLIRASVPGTDEARELFGIPLENRGIQAVWMEITNNSGRRARFAPYSVDPEYFPPHEVAYMYRKKFSKAGWREMEARFSDLSLPRYIEAGATVSGYVFTHLREGTKAFNVDVFYTDKAANYEHFTFFLEVPGFKPDHAEVNFAALYTPDQIVEVNTDGLREQIAGLPCCTVNQAGTDSGQPIEIFLVGDGHSLLQALLRAGWDETSSVRDAEYLSATDYFYGRPADAVFKKSRGGSFSTERNELGIWLTPIRVEGRGVWAVQVKHAIGRRFEIEERFLGVKLDPDVNEGRNYLLQNLWYSNSLEQFAWSATGKRVTETEPVLDFNDNAWFSDGLRLVIWVSGEPVSLQEAQTVKWDDPSSALFEEENER